ncbi:anthranilate synthase component I family protein [Blastopirellula sp. JC732]|uniref:Anthranilate synthase component I family protein n=1 Tax=Blastopirellula sediminis TaxID=2894196 RepID=A0A9X1MJ04_9BACT|nr:anthranilate synthase component I family protein [Blastopirellula sediminis]MCC9608147.1 anthranilate synthase component I family protein [Blastopirellula sediminis]MCC9627060.1 anthranilate synthase component I family protein [Blastopirellula sediminis]
MNDPAPVIVPLPNFDVVAAWEKLREAPRCLFLDSALQHVRLGRYSFLTADPWAWFVEQEGSLPEIAALLKQFETPTIAGLPPFQGGAAGLFGYEFGAAFEGVAPAEYDEFSLPQLAIGFYDVVIGVDHASGDAWLISQGFPETNKKKRKVRAQQRADQFLHWLQVGVSPEEAKRTKTPSPLSADKLAPQFATPHAGVTSSFSQSAYLAAVERSVEYVRAGDIFQVNLSQRLLHPAVTDPATLYRSLRTCNAAPFASYFDMDDATLLSASPERFVQVRGRKVETRPIKGTRRRSGRPEWDMYAGGDLLASEKDRAENIMIVDLMRNDLSRVCQDESVAVTELCVLEQYATVQHLVSTIVANLRDDASPIDLLPAAFPGGSITGAPKIRAMQIIAELEPTVRGPYCGSLGYMGLDGTIDLNILIRTVTAARGWWQFPVGGGLVVQSDPQREYEETWHKAAGILQAIAALS